MMPRYAIRLLGVPHCDVKYLWGDLPETLANRARMYKAFGTVVDIPAGPGRDDVEIGVEKGRPVCEVTPHSVTFLEGGA